MRASGRERAAAHPDSPQLPRKCPAVQFMPYKLIFTFTERPESKELN